ncbi:MAG: 23S rRNA (guanosine(2251)-2'-O)-methyltransferase RlmB [Brevinematales bacterium]|nr:23S rRNA (guanosine(2251)-2'-O)-methyltransferase RlmB [Brevinematales bacterium]
MFIYGRNSVSEALTDSIEIDSIYIDKQKKKKFIPIIKQAQEKEIKIVFVFENEIEKLSHTQKHQGICAKISLPQNIYENEEDFLLTEDIKNILILDGITDTGNLGAIVRSALLLGCDLVILPNDNSARITPQTIKASAGGIYKQKILYVNNLNSWIMNLKEEGFCVVGFAGEANKVLSELKNFEKIACIIGSEHKGLRKSTRKICDELVKIPTTGKLDSLNASVASAIVMWEIFMKNRG